MHKFPPLGDYHLQKPLCPCPFGECVWTWYLLSEGTHRWTVQRCHRYHAASRFVHTCPVQELHTHKQQVTVFPSPAPVFHPSILLSLTILDADVTGLLQPSILKAHPCGSHFLSWIIHHTYVVHFLSIPLLRDIKVVYLRNNVNNTPYLI